jgi:hypothetical protein
MGWDVESLLYDCLSGVQIEWDDGKTQFFHHNNMNEVSNSPLR